MSDLSWSSLPFDVIRFIIIVLVFASDSSFSLHLLFFSYHDPSRVWYSLHITITHLIISLICFICLLVDTMFTLGTIRSMAHGIYCTCCISYMRAWVLIIGYLSLVSLRFYHPITLAYITSRVLRPPWGHGIRYRLLRLLCGQVFEIRLTSKYFPCIFFWETLLRCLDSFQPCLDY